MGSQYIRGITDLKTINKRNKKMSSIRFKGIYRYFTMVYWVFASENGKFSTKFSTFSTME